MKTRLMISSSMTPVEQAAGRFLRAPDDHPTDAGMVMVDVPEAPPAAPPTAPGEKTIEQQYDEEFGGVDPDASGEGEGEGESTEPAKAEPEAEPKPEGAPDQSKLDELEARNRQLEGALEEARRAKEPAAPVEEQLVPEVAAPDPKDYEFGAADEKFIADNARWHAEARFNELQEAKQIEERIAAVETKWKGAIEADPVKEQYPDFDTLVTKGADEKKWACSPTMAVMIKNSDVGPHVAYMLASNADESRRIAQLDPQEQLLEFGRLEGRALAKAESASAAPAAPPQKRQTSAPTPPAARSRGSGGQYAAAQDALYDKMLSEFN